MDLKFLTFETNGTQKLLSEFETTLNEYATTVGLEITFSVSSKLPCSGQSWESAIKPDVVKEYTQIYGNRSYFKFVVADYQDIFDVIQAVAEYENADINIPTYLMPVGGTEKTYQLNEKAVADYCRDYGFRFSPRLQISLYKNAIGT
jgi:organic radical activating enzyme